MKAVALLNNQTGTGRIMICQIRIKGVLSDQWSEWFQGLSIIPAEDGNTFLTGPVADQAALFGLLRKVRDLGMPLLSVNCIEDNTLTDPGTGRTDTAAIKNQKKGVKKMNTYRKTAIIVGVLFIIGTLSGCLGATVMGSLLGVTLDLGKIATQGNMITLGALLTLLMGLVLAFVPLLLYPIFKKHNEILAVGYVVFRGALETVACIASAVIFLVLGTLSQEFVKAGAPASSLLQGQASLLLAGNDWITAMGSIVFALGALMYNRLWFTSRLIPRWISVWGFTGAILYLTEPLFWMFGVKYELLFAPLAIQEMVMAVWLIVKGFNSAATTSELHQ